MKIRIECKGADILPLDAIEEFQGNLKKRTQKDIDKIIKSIDKFGFSFPFFIWCDNGRNRCLDGHGRIEALKKISQKGVDLPLFPVIYVDAKDEEEAIQKLLRLNSQYGQMTLASVMEFAKGLMNSNVWALMRAGVSNPLGTTSTKTGLSATLATNRNTYSFRYIGGLPNAF